MSVSSYAFCKDVQLLIPNSALQFYRGSLSSSVSCLVIVFADPLLNTGLFLSGITAANARAIASVQCLVFLEPLSNADTSELNTSFNACSHNQQLYVDILQGTCLQTHRCRSLAGTRLVTGLLLLPKSVHLFHQCFIHNQQPRD